MTSGGLEHCAKPWQVVEPPLGETFGSQFAVRICYRVGKAKHSGREAMTLGSV
jgi:hypothetical protein